MSTDENYDERTKAAAFQIVQVLRGLSDPNPSITQKLRHVTQLRVQRILAGEPNVIDGECTEIPEPVEIELGQETDQEAS